MVKIASSLLTVVAVFSSCDPQTENSIDATQAKRSLCVHLLSVGAVGTSEAEVSRFIEALEVDRQLLSSAGDDATAEKVADAIRDLRAGPTESVEVSVFLRAGISDRELAALDSTLSGHPNVASFDYVSAPRAYEEFVEIYKDKPEFYKDLPRDALPASFRIHTQAGTSSESLVTELQALPGVDEVRGGGPIQRLVGPIRPLIDLCGGLRSLSSLRH